MMKHVKILGVAAALMISGAALSGCDMQIPPNTTTSKISLVPGDATHEFTTASVDADAISGIISNHHRYGDGPIEVTVTYDPQSASNSAMKASDQAERISRLLRKRGIENAMIDTLPVSGQGGRSMTYVSYKTLEAMPPADCHTMAGLDHRETNPMPNDYGYGCTVDTLLARQIANPRDLRGRDGVTGSDGRRQSTVVDPVRSGATLGPVSGASSSF